MQYTEYVCKYAYICVYICINICVYICKIIYMYIYMYKHMCIYMYKWVCVHTYMCICKHSYISTWLHLHDIYSLIYYEVNHFHLGVHGVLSIVIVNQSLILNESLNVRSNMKSIYYLLLRRWEDNWEYNWVVAMNLNTGTKDYISYKILVANHFLT
jgi:hypothetical protein